MARVLVVDDEEELRGFLCDALEGAGHAVFSARDGNAALALLEQRAFDVVLTDLRMPGLDGEQLVRVVRSRWPDTAVVVLTAYGTVRTAVDVMKLGAVEFLEKPVESPQALRLVVARAAVGGGGGGGARAQAKLGAEGGAESVQLTWGAPAMVPVEAALRRVAATDSTVLLLGASGTGKEVAARMLHRWSKRADGPFVAVNCASLSEALLESELFGHEKGAFTGASATRVGRIETAARGTFFLDEIGDLRGELQARLLRVIQEREFTRVGGTRSLPADVRWVAATHRDLLREVRAGRFREDLYHRLAVFPVRMPSLAERREDIPALADALLARIARAVGKGALRLSSRARASLSAHAWPGNVRELANALERAVILSDGPEVDVALGAEEMGASGAVDAGGTMEQIERRAIEQALEQASGNRRRAADALGIGLRTLYEKLKKYQMG